MKLQLISGTVACVLSLALYAAADEEEKGVVVELDGLKSRAPAAWKREKSTSEFRPFQFKLPKAKDADKDGELIILYFGPGRGGSAEENLKRWKAMMIPPKGKTIDDVAKVDKFKVGEVPVTCLDVEGTFKFRATPTTPDDKVELWPNYRLAFVMFESLKGPYFIRVVGPAKTVAEHKKAFDKWLKGFAKE